MRNLLTMLLLCAALAWAQLPRTSAPAAGGGQFADDGTTLSTTKNLSMGTTVVTNSVIAPPEVPVLAYTGTPGATTWSYLIAQTALSPAIAGIPSCCTSASVSASVGSAANTLTVSNYVTVQLPSCTDGGVSIDVYRSVPTTFYVGYVGNFACGATFNDTGLPITNIGNNWWYDPYLDHSVAVATTNPIVSTSLGSAFGNLAQADPALIGYNAQNSLGLGVYTDTANVSGFRYNKPPFLVYVLGDSDESPNGAVFYQDFEAGSPSGNNGAITWQIKVAGSTTPATGFYGFGQNGSWDVRKDFDATATTYDYTGGPDSFGITGTHWGFQIGGVTADSGVNFYAFGKSGGSSGFTNEYIFWSENLAGTATNPYYAWFDSRGVFRIKEDNTFDSVGQAIPALYNPQFTKYTPGAADYERIVMQWESNVAVLTTEKGGTGTLQSLQLGDANVPVLISDLKNTGAAGSKKVVCVDTSSGRLYASSTGTDCSN